MTDSNTALRISLRGLAFVMRNEGFSASEYKDVAGCRTIGYGHKLKAGEHYDGVISIDQAEALLHTDMAFAEEAIHRLVKVTLTQTQYDALASFVYNIGAAAFAASTLLISLNAGNYRGAADEMTRWDKIHKNGLVTESAGLAARRAAERAMFCETS